jgi:hypothetical protein
MLTRTVIQNGFCRGMWLWIQTDYWKARKDSGQTESWKDRQLQQWNLEVQGMYQKASRSSLESFEWPLQQ